MYQTIKKFIDSHRIATALLALLIASTAWAVAEGAVDRYSSTRPAHFVQGMYIGPTSINPTGSTLNKMTRVLGASATVDFASAKTGVSESTGITVTGAQAGDPCFVGVPTAAGALDADFGCYVSAADTVKVTFAPHDVNDGSLTTADAGTGTGVGTATVVASSHCVCSTNGTDPSKTSSCSVSSTTLSGYSADESISIKYVCYEPVDPASGTYYVRVISSQ